MSRISEAILDTLLEEITDYELVSLGGDQLRKLQASTSYWENKASIESEINVFLKKEGYAYNDDECKWMLVGDFPAEKPIT